GKSAAAEAAAAAAARAAGRPLIYLATMERGGREAEARIQKHRAQRAEKGFVTVEKARAVHELSLPADAVVLLEDLGNLVGNELFSPEAEERSEETVLRELRGSLLALEKKCAQLILVGALFAEEPRYGESDTERYVRLFSALQNGLAARADAVYLSELGAVRCLKRKEAL
uniref:bifunctional adenosylcobinamide kinase/adenosylcobinamide-phosphate guanylyltransferase n=1 Tax=Stomatobaculum longum TaxID=796942 RepID=UPI0028041D16